MCNICNCVSGFHISEDSVNQSGKQILSQISSSKSRMSCYTKCKTLILICLFGVFFWGGGLVNK